MIVVSRVKEAVKEFIKVVRFGKSDVITASNYLPFGVDSKPRKNALALVADTAESGKKAVLGYKIVSDKTKPGEAYFYATDSTDSIVFYLHLKENGTCEFNGNTDNLVKYIPLNSGLQSLKTSINAELVKIATAISSLGGAYTVSPVSVDISGSKIDEIKV